MCFAIDLFGCWVLGVKDLFGTNGRESEIVGTEVVKDVGG